MSERPVPHEMAILKALLQDEHAHELYHQEAGFRASVIGLSSMVALLLQDMTLAADVRLEGMRAAVERAQHEVFGLPPRKREED